MDLELTKAIGVKRNLFSVEKISLAYSLITGIMILILFPRMDHPIQMLLERFAIVGITLGLSLLGAWWPNKLMVLVRVGFQMGLLSYWYPDTYEFNRLFQNLDHVFATIEQSLFGFQPALEFSVQYPKLWISEAFNMGYFSYYPMIALVTLAYFFQRYEEFSKVAFILVGSFFLYYFLYIFIPVAGPQFYFPAIGLDNVHAGVFPSIGDFFNYSQTLHVGPYTEKGLFCQLVETSQQVGERPTAAFPSSHVGISTILMILAWRVNKSIFGFMFPFYLLLCGATVYIQAHYAIDVLAGFVSAFIIYGVVLYGYNAFFKQNDFSLKSYTISK